MKISRRLVGLVSALFLILAVGTVALFGRSTNEFPAGKPGPEITIVINSGEYGSSIAAKLEAGGVVKKASTFITAIANDPRGNSIAPGSHLVHTHIPSKQALSELLDSKRNRGALILKEGNTYSDVIAALKKANISISGKNPQPVLANNRNSLEGQLFPATYSFAPGTNSSQALTAMVEKFHNVSRATGLIGGFEKYSAYEVLTVASMVQIEGDPTDYSKVARVIYNRLRIGMPLQLNSTVQYVANLRGKIALSRNATKIQSPYNTYLHTGLTPTPISNPGEAAINASLHPIDGNWLYFITVKPHDTRFTNDFATFQEWVALYNNNLANGAFR